MQLAFESIGLFVTILVCLGVFTFIFSLFISDSKQVIDEDTILPSFFVIMLVLLLFASIFFVQFKHYPEKFGYTAIEEVEEVEETE